MLPEVGGRTKYLEQPLHPSSLAERELGQSSSFQARKRLSVLFNFPACWEMASVLSPFTGLGRKYGAGRSNTADLGAGRSCYRQRLDVTSCKVFTPVLDLSQLPGLEIKQGTVSFL